MLSRGLTTNPSCATLVNYILCVRFVYIYVLAPFVVLLILFFTLNIICVSGIASITRFLLKIAAGILAQSYGIASIDLLSHEDDFFTMAFYDCTDLIFPIINFSNVFCVSDQRNKHSTDGAHKLKVLYTVREIV